MLAKSKIEIVTAASAELFERAHLLFREYADSLGVDLYFQSFDEELANLETIYSPPAGALLLAFCDEQIAGCVGVRQFEAAICEMKRLYVKPEFQNRKIGRLLAVTVIERAREIGYEKMRLDTLPLMTQAQNLYRSLGFREITRYRYNPDSNAIFMELDLRFGNG
jgi:ribosomal protein S18 acetylase RimI-like enzyme